MTTILSFEPSVASEFRFRQSHFRTLSDLEAVLEDAEGPFRLSVTSAAAGNLATNPTKHHRFASESTANSSKLTATRHRRYTSDSSKLTTTTRYRRYDSGSYFGDDDLTQSTVDSSISWYMESFGSLDSYREEAAPIPNRVRTYALDQGEIECILQQPVFNSLAFLEELEFVVN